MLTNDGYKIYCEAKDQAWTITSPDGKTTRIWGDPHVVESDGDKFDFQAKTSFVFGKNKITVEVSPLENGNALTGKITIYNGEQRVTIADIEKDKPRISAVAADGKIHDASLADGSIYRLTKEKNGDDEWKKDSAK